MILRVCNYTELIKRLQGKTLIFFGAGRMAEVLCNDIPGFGVDWSVKYFVDNNAQKWNTHKVIQNCGIPVRPPEYLYDNADMDTIILITGNAFHEIYNQLQVADTLANVQCYIGNHLIGMQMDEAFTGIAATPKKHRANKQMRIPKVIHYTWFSGEPIPQKYQDCIASWRKYCPDYEIIEWNQNNSDFRKSRYAREAISAEKWGFAGDYIRLDVVYDYGGIYLDLDVEVIRNLDDLLYNDAYCGFESCENVNFGSGFGASKGFPLIKAAKEAYESEPFILANGELNLKASPEYQTKTLREYGLKRNGMLQIISGMTVYPAINLCAKNWMNGKEYISSDTYSVHRFDGSWMEAGDAQTLEFKNSLLERAVQNEKDLARSPNLRL